MESTRRSGFPGDAVLKNLTAHAEATGDMGLIPWLGRSPGGGTWQATVHGAAESDMTEQLSIHTHVL